MAKPLMREVGVHSDIESLSRAAAAWLVECISLALSRRDRFTLVLSGGKTPIVLYRMLAGEFSGRIAWDKLHLYWVDERYVPYEDPRSNFGRVRDTLLDLVSVPAINVHPMPTDRELPDESAIEYESLLRRDLGGEWPSFDAVLLGIGADGHTASLFPGSPVLDERRRWVATAWTTGEAPVRLTLTLPVLNAAANVAFLASGNDKAGALSRALVGRADAWRCPASAVRPARGTLRWFVDEDAASRLSGASLTDIRIVKFPKAPG
jgi:6-phosphogluconolactonase